MFVRIQEKLASWLKRQEEKRLLDKCGTVMTCPWCKETVQKYSNTRISSEKDSAVCIVHCGNCGGRSVFQWGFGMMYQGPLDHPLIDDCLQMPKNSDDTKDYSKTHPLGGSHRATGNHTLRYINTNRDYFYHATMESARREKARLREKHPNITFRTLKIISCEGIPSDDVLDAVSDQVRYEREEESDESDSDK